MNLSLVELAFALRGAFQLQIFAEAKAVLRLRCHSLASWYRGRWAHHFVTSVPIREPTNI